MYDDYDAKIKEYNNKLEQIIKDLEDKKELK